MWSGTLLIGIFFLLIGVAFGSTRASVLTEKHGSPIQVFVNTVKNAKRHLAAAAVARSTAIFTMYPVDTIKVRMQ